MYHRRHFYILTVIIILLCSITSHAQGNRMFNTDRDLSGSLINHLYQDHNGMMWVSTEDGLNRYDGNKFTIYRNVPGDTTSLCNNYVKAIAEDETGRIYVCTRAGIQIYNPGTDSFDRRMVEPNGNEFTGISNNIVRRSDNEYWSIGNYVYKFSITGPDALVMKPVEDYDMEIKNIHCGIVDHKGDLWLSQSDSRVFRITPDNKLYSYFNEKKHPSVTAMAIGADNQLYIGTESDGLMVYDVNTDSFRTVSHTTTKEIKSLFVFKNGDIAQATDGDGVIVYSPVTGESHHLIFGDSEMDTSRQKTHCLLVDDDDNLWIGIYQSGVIMIPHRHNSFGYLGHRFAGTNVIGRNCISSIYSDNQGDLWVGADNDGIYHLNNLNNKYDQIAHFTSDDINLPMCIYQDSYGQMWVGTYLNGVGKLDRNTGKYNKLDVSSDSEYPANNCISITEDKNHYLWFGMLNSGLIRYNLNTGKVENDFDWREKIPRWVQSLYYSQKTNSLYVGTYTGLCTINNVSVPDPEVSTTLPNDIIYSIDESSDGAIWLGTSNGLVRFMPNTGETTRYDMNNGLLTNTVYSVR